jgi:predicted PurR-regulated permease PerM
MLIAWELRGVLVSICGMLFVAFIINAGLRPVINSLEKRRVPRWLAVALVYIALLVVLGVVVAVIATEFVNQIVNFFNALPDIVARLIAFVRTTLPFLENVIPLNLLEQEVEVFVEQALQSEIVLGFLSQDNLLTVLTRTLGVFSSVAELLVSVITILIISVYMVLREKPVYEGVLGLLPEKTAASWRSLLRKIESSLGSWMVGQVSLMFIIGFITYLIVLFPGFFDPTYTLDDFALPIALVAGIFEALPNVGPAITLVTTVILALGTSGVGTVAYVAVAFTLLQNIESVFIVPMVMKRAIGVDPILSILGIIAGFQLAGVIGAILAIPFIGIAQIFINEAAAEYKRFARQRPKLVE